MSSTNDKRHTTYVDATVQGAILRQAVYHWFVASMIFAGTLFIFRVLPHIVAGDPLNMRILWFYFAPMVFSSAVFLPMICTRAVQFSHRFVGPMVRFRTGIAQMAKGEDMDEISLRMEDFWQDVAGDLNTLAVRVREENAFRRELEEVFPDSRQSLMCSTDEETPAESAKPTETSEETLNAC